MLKVSCGQCVGCRAERARQWGVRGMHELQMADQVGAFVTLTYANEELPENGQLIKKDWQDFAKALRHKCGPFRFLMCGEYGARTETERCHFHAAIFGHDFIYPKESENRKFYKKNEQGHSLFTSPALGEVWKKGHHLFGDITFDSCNYVAGYINKKVNGRKAKKHYERINIETGEVYDQVPEFALMSRNHGLGHSWIEKFHPEVYPADSVCVNGREAQPPAYYDRWYKEHYPERFEEVAEKRKRKGILWEADNTPARLAVKKKVFIARRALYKQR